MYYHSTPFFGETDLDTPPATALRSGSRGPAVADLQRKLNVWSDQAGSTVARLVEDGNFGPVTAARVRSFQQAVGLSPDGVVGAETLQQLDRLVGNASSPRPASPGAPVVAPKECERIRQSCELLARFDFDKSTLRPEHLPLIRNITQCVVDSFGTPKPIRSILVIGHADTVGKEGYNCGLGLRRAAAVKQALGRAIAGECTSRGLRPCPVTINRIVAQSFGERRPLPEVPGDDPQNRRVEVCLFTTPTPQLRPGACASPGPQPPPPPRPSGDCFGDLAKCALNCGLDHFLGKLKRIPQYIKLLPTILPCTRLGNPYAIAACILATAGPELLPEDFADLKRITECLKGCKRTFDTCRSVPPGPTPPPKPKQNGNCFSQAAACVGNCGLDHFIAKLRRTPQYLKLVPKVLPCLKQKNPYAIAACVLAAVGPDLLQDDLGDLNKIVNCLKNCKREFDACRP